MIRKRGHLFPYALQNQTFCETLMESQTRQGIHVTEVTSLDLTHTNYPALHSDTLNKDTQLPADRTPNPPHVKVMPFPMFCYQPVLARDRKDTGSLR